MEKGNFLQRLETRIKLYSWVLFDFSIGLIGSAIGGFDELWIYMNNYQSSLVQHFWLSFFGVLIVVCSGK